MLSLDGQMQVGDGRGCLGRGSFWRWQRRAMLHPACGVLLAAGWLHAASCWLLDLHIRPALHLHIRPALPA